MGIVTTTSAKDVEVGRKRAVFLDRDGVINKKAPEQGRYITTWEEFEFLPGVAAAIRQLTRSGFSVFVVTNQRGVARRFMTQADLEAIHRKMVRSLREEGAELAGIYTCPHEADAGCGCRKPNPGMILSAASEHDIDLAASWVIGDSTSDIEAGKRAGCRTVLLTNGFPPRNFDHVMPDWVAENLSEAVIRIVGMDRIENRDPDDLKIGWGAKRALDLLLSGTGLLLSAPLWGLISLAIKLEDWDGVFYDQTRMGRGGRILRVLKFRSMVRDAERATGAVWAAANDARVTRVGRILRATALDELPQLWNIFKGEMSFVGPRPERPELVAQFRQEIPGYDQRFAVRPGLTGLAQIYGQYDSHPRNKLRYDLLYIKNQSLWLDLKLIALSFWITLRGKWEYRGRKF